MESWSNNTFKILDLVEKKLTIKEQIKFKTKNLRKMINDVGLFSEDGCNDCLVYKDTLERILNQLLNNTHDKREFMNLYSIILNHLVKSHGAVRRGQFVYLYMIICSTTGGLLSVLSGISVTFGLIIGVLFGALFGLIREVVAIKENTQYKN